MKPSRAKRKDDKRRAAITKAKHVNVRPGKNGWYTYSPSQIHLAFNGVTLEGHTDGTFIETPYQMRTGGVVTRYPARIWYSDDVNDNPNEGTRGLLCEVYGPPSPTDPVTYVARTLQNMLSEHAHADAIYLRAGMVHPEELQRSRFNSEVWPAEKRLSDDQIVDLCIVVELECMRVQNMDPSGNGKRKRLAGMSRALGRWRELVTRECTRRGIDSGAMAVLCDAVQERRWDDVERVKERSKRHKVREFCEATGWFLDPDVGSPFPWTPTRSPPVTQE